MNSFRTTRTSFVFLLRLLGQRRARCRRWLSDSSSSSSSSSSSKPPKKPLLAAEGGGTGHQIGESLQDAYSSSVVANSGLLQLCRHGHGDAVVTLNVGGKEFYTLRSTVASNEVLAECVARAEANQELTHGGTAVFIDRDPTFFPLILNHLRNKVEGLSYYSSSKKYVHHKKLSIDYHVQLPKDIGALRDIYVEASHYRIPELQHASCKENVLVTITSAFGGGGANPFDQANRMMQVLRRGLVAAGSVGTVAFTAQQDVNFTRIGTVLFPAWFPDQSKPKEGAAPKAQDEIAA